MRTIAVFVAGWSVALLVFAFPFPLAAADASVSVTAQGTVSVKPDMAELQIRLTDTAKTAEKATSLVASKHKTVQAALQQAGIKADDIATRSFTVRQEWEWNNAARKRVFKGYTALHVLKVTVRTISKTGSAVDAAVQAGADEIPVIGFTSSRFREKRREALAKAVANAKKDALAMARAAGMSLGPLLDLQTGARPLFPARNSVAGMAEKAMAPPVPTEITPGEQDITVTVTCTWSLAANR